MQFEPIQHVLTLVGGRSGREISQHNIELVSRALRLVVVFHFLLQMNGALSDPYPPTRISCDRGRVVVRLGALLVVVVAVPEAMLGSFARAGHTMTAAIMLATVGGFMNNPFVWSRGGEMIADGPPL